MKKFYTMLRVATAFFIFLLLVSYIWFVAESALYPEINDLQYMDYLLYLLGYGELDIPNLFGKSFFSVIGLLTLTLLSSVLTVNLFEWRSKLTLNKKLLVCKSTLGLYRAELLMKCRKTDIYDTKIELIVYEYGNTYTEECYIPFIPKNTSRSVKFDILPGKAFYKYLRRCFDGAEETPIAIVTVTYTDISGGEEYRMCQMYAYDDDPKKNNVIFGDAVLKGIQSKASAEKLFEAACMQKSELVLESVKEYVRNKVFAIDLMQTQEINADILSLKNDLGESVTERAFSAKVSFVAGKAYEPYSFGMACIHRPLGGEWKKYYDMNCCLEFKIKASVGLSVTFELKGNCGAKVIDERINGNGELCEYSYDLSAYSEEEFESITELCFSVFYRDVKTDDLSGTFCVHDCELVAQV